MIDTDGREWAAQLKVDGYRGMLHAEWDGESHNITIFSRRMNDISESLPELTSELELPAGDFILDGEIISSDGSYSETSARIGRKEENVERDVEMEYKVFDAVIYAGENLWNQPFRTRHSRLRSLDLNTGDTIELLPLEFDYEKAKSHALENEQEGLILKRMDAPYEFDKRSKAWIKEKNTSEDIDVIISDIVEGEGRLNGTMGKLSIESKDGVDVGNVGTGFTDSQREKIWKNAEEWVGKVIEVEAEAFDDGLRFPRYSRDRTDDGEADTIERIKNLLPEA